jgi:nucleotide-binding universal stress UspA family protein
MMLRHLVVHVDSSERCAVRLELAVDLAQRFDATLSGLFAENDPHVMTVAALDPAGALAPDALAAETTFRARTEMQRLRTHWHTVMTASDDALIRQTVAVARNADLVILGQHDPDRRDIRVPAEFPEQVILQSGRPVLVVPYAGRFKSIGRRALIAWNGSREAARAQRCVAAAEFGRVRGSACNQPGAGKPAGREPIRASHAAPAGAWHRRRDRYSTRRRYRGDGYAAVTPDR